MFHFVHQLVAIFLFVLDWLFSVDSSPPPTSFNLSHSIRHLIHCKYENISENGFKLLSHLASTLSHFNCHLDEPDLSVYFTVIFFLSLVLRSKNHPQWLHPYIHSYTRWAFQLLIKFRWRRTNAHIVISRAEPFTSEILSKNVSNHWSWSQSMFSQVVSVWLCVWERMF